MKIKSILGASIFLFASMQVNADFIKWTYKATINSEFADLLNIDGEELEIVFVFDDTNVWQKVGDDLYFSPEYWNANITGGHSVSLNTAFPVAKHADSCCGYMVEEQGSDSYIDLIVDGELTLMSGNGIASSLIPSEGDNLLTGHLADSASLYTFFEFTSINGDLAKYNFSNISITAFTANADLVIVDSETNFRSLVSSVFTEGFESFPTNICQTGGPSPSDNINTANFSVTTIPQDGGTSFLCTGTTSAGLPGPTEGTNALIAGSNTGDTWILDFTMNEAIHGVYFELTDAVERGDAFLLVPGFGPILVASQGSGGLNTVRFGVVFDSPFTSFSLLNTGRSDGWGIDNMLFAQVLTPVTIDIKPSSDPNSVNPRSKGVIPVAVLGTIDFDATQVDPTTFTFGPNGALPAHNGHVEDVNKDGFMDSVFHFRTQETGIVCGDTEATLSGEIFDGTPITGTDTVNTVGCNTAASTAGSNTATTTSAGTMSWMLMIGLGVLGLWRRPR